MTPCRAHGRLVVPTALVLAAWILAGCSSIPPQAPPASRPVQSAWVVTDQWDAFAQSTLWPQEWALGQWHRYRFTPQGLDLTPVAPLPPLPNVRRLDQGGDPRVWRLDWPGPLPRGTGVRVSFGSAETQGLPPSLWALQQALTEGEGRVRVVQREYVAGRFTIALEVVRGLGD